VARDLGVARNTLTGWVREADAAAVPEAIGLLEAVQSGDRKAYLEAVRDQLAKTIDGGLAARDLPPNVRLLNETMRELEEMQTREREEAADAANAPDEDWDEDDI
jgi:transposase-like protein